MKKVFLFILISILLVSVGSCRRKKITSYQEMDRIIYSGLLKEAKDQYYVIIYATGCTYCEELLPTVLEYANYAQKKHIVPIYALNLSEKRVNSGINSESDDEYQSFLHTSDYTKIRFTNAPGLIYVMNGQVENYISSKTTLKPMSEIRTYLQEMMK